MRTSISPSPERPSSFRHYATAPRIISYTCRKSPRPPTPRHTGKLLTGFTGEAFTYLQKYSWPGNLRELCNIIERIVILARRPIIELADLPPNMIGRQQFPTSQSATLSLLNKSKSCTFEPCSPIHTSLENTAKIIGIDHATLWRRRKKYGL